VFAMEMNIAAPDRGRYGGAARTGGRVCAAGLVTFPREVSSHEQLIFLGGPISVLALQRRHLSETGI